MKKNYTISTYSANKQRSISSEFIRFSNFKAGAFIEVLMSEFGLTARDIERRTGFSHTTIDNMRGIYRQELAKLEEFK